MKIKFETVDDITVLFIKEDRLDANNSEDLKKELQQQFAAGKKNIIMDLTEIHFIDSSGLGALVSGYKNASTIHGSLKLTNLQSQVKSMFELTRLHRVFDIFTTIDEAVQSFK